MKSFWRSSPVTAVLIGASVTLFLLEWIAHLGLGKALGFFYGGGPLAHAWAGFTYPFASSGDGGELVGHLFSWLALYMFGAQVEREMESRRYAALWVALSVLPALALTIASAISPAAGALLGMYLPLAGLVVVWAMRNPEATVLFSFVIPIKAKWLALITAALVLFGYGTPYPVVGVFACFHLGLAWAFASEKLKFLPFNAGPSSRVLKRTDMMSREFYDDAKRRQKEREEKDALRKLFERSLISDPDDPDTGSKSKEN